MPDRLEAGTINAFGLAGLAAGVQFIKQEGLDNIGSKEKALTRRLVEGLKEIKGVEVYGPRQIELRSSVVSFNIKSLDGAEVAAVLDEQFDVLTRPGIHCAPLAHETIGTFPLGAVRMSVGYFNTEDEIDQAINAISIIAREANFEEVEK
jgi:cysteine desulfurase/selenocysteine lyase